MSKQLILDAAIRFARVDGYQNIRREKIAKALEISCGMVNHHFNTMAQLRRAVMRYAVDQAIIEVVAQGLAMKDPQALKAPEHVKAAARASL